MICFEVPGGKAAEKIFLTRDNYYGAHPVLFDLTFRYGGENLYLQVCPNRGDSKKADCPSKKWFDYLAEAMNPAGISS